MFIAYCIWWEWMFSWICKFAPWEFSACSSHKIMSILSETGVAENCESHYVGAGNQTQVICKINTCSLPLRYLESPLKWIFTAESHISTKWKMSGGEHKPHRRNKCVYLLLLCDHTLRWHGHDLPVFILSLNSLFEFKESCLNLSVAKVRWQCP